MKDSHTPLLSWDETPLIDRYIAISAPLEDLRIFAVWNRHRSDMRAEGFVLMSSIGRMVYKVRNTPEQFEKINGIPKWLRDFREKWEYYQGLFALLNHEILDV